MIAIDGKEGGGQILRTAIGLSAVTGNPIRVVNIRGARCSPGLGHQHLMGVKIAGDFCNAEVNGLKVGSTEVEFIPKSLDFMSRKIDIGTAGSIPLLLQTLMPILIFSDEKITLEITGGTDVDWSPNMFYFQHVFCDFMKMMGGNIFVEILKHGFYPKGGGKVRVEIAPTGKLKPLNLLERGKLLRADAWSIATENLSGAKVAERQVAGLGHALKMEIGKKNINYVSSLSPGSSIHAHVHFQNCKLGSGCVGKRGKPAEEVGSDAGKELRESMDSGAPFDKYMSDQILPFLALAEGNSRIMVEKVTEHCMTNISVIEKILPVKFEINDRKISVVGVRK